ncbi:hypothetical protein ENBRE01_0731 [Enteropsectra breve]|nr:hypothetical protein ENBRE01_0731 [Enteropsectra breve]
MNQGTPNLNKPARGRPRKAQSIPPISSNIHDLFAKQNQQYSGQYYDKYPESLTDILGGSNIPEPYLPSEKSKRIHFESTTREEAHGVQEQYGYGDAGGFKGLNTRDAMPYSKQWQNTADYSIAQNKSLYGTSPVENNNVNINEKNNIGFDLDAVLEESAERNCSYAPEGYSPNYGFSNDRIDAGNEDYGMHSNYIDSNEHEGIDSILGSGMPQQWGRDSVPPNLLHDQLFSMPNHAKTRNEMKMGFQGEKTGGIPAYLDNPHYLYRPPMSFPYGMHKKRRALPKLWNTSSYSTKSLPMPSSKYSSLEYIQKKDTKFGPGGLNFFSGEYSGNLGSLSRILECKGELAKEHRAVLDAYRNEIKNTDLDNLTVADLKLIMKKYGINHMGKKNELILMVKTILSKVEVLCCSLPENKNSTDEEPKKEEAYDRIFF